MWPPPLFRRRPRAAQIVGAVVLPIGFGALCGYLLGASQPGFNIAMLLAGVGGVLAGFEHASPREGVLRGLCGGALFATALAAVFEARGVAALTPLPAGLPVMAVFYAATGLPLGAFGGWLRRRSDDRRARAQPASTA